MSPPAPEQIPPPETHSRGPTVVHLNPSNPARHLLNDLFRLPELLEDISGGSSRLAGRTTCWHWRPDGGQPGYLVRQYVHGGALGRLWGALFTDSERMQRELRVVRYAVLCGVPTPHPVALRVERVWGPFVEGHLVTEYIPDALNLLELCKGDQEGWPPQRRHAAAHAVAGAVARMHDAGIDHADLNLKNILVQPGDDGLRTHIIDLDKAVVRRPLPLGRRMANLVRLDRSVLKWAASRQSVTLSDRLRVVRSYLGHYPDWRSQWRQILRTHATRHLRHVLTRQA